MAGDNKKISLLDAATTLAGTDEAPYITGSPSVTKRITAQNQATALLDLVDATAAEVTTGTSTAKVVTPDALAGSAYGKRIVQIKVVADDTVVTTGDGKIIFCVPPELNGYNLVDADAFVTTVSSSGTPTVQLRNVTDSADMLSTLITIDASEYTSYSAAAAPVIDATHDDVATGDLIAIDVDVSGTGAKGLGVTMEFQLP